MNFVDNIEPDMNSYDVAYMVKVFKPHWNVGISRKRLELMISEERCRFLRKWAATHANHFWFVDKAWL